MRKILILIVALWCVACSRGGYDHRLLRAESVISHHADSALAILDSISLPHLSRDRDRALYAMLLTQAQEKLHLSPTSDSLIAIATDYYDRHPDPVRHAISHYYRGIVQYNANRYAPAIVSLFKAREIASDHDLHFWRGMACRGISDIYNKTYNTAEEIKYAREEYEYISKSGIQPYINYALLDYARAYSNKHELQKSDSLIIQVVDSARVYQDSLLLFYAMQLQGTNLVLTDKYEDALIVMKDVCTSPFAESLDSFLLCYSLIELGNIKEADKLLTEYINNEVDIHSKLELTHKLAARRHDYANAYKACDSTLSITNSEIRKNASNTLSSSLSDYLTVEKHQVESELKASKLKLWSAISVGIISIAALCILSLYLHHRQQQRIEEKIFLAEQLQEDIEQLRKQEEIEKLRKQEEIERLRKQAEIERLRKQEEIEKLRKQEEIEKLEKLNTEKPSEEDITTPLNVIESLMSSKYQLLDELCFIVTETPDTRIARRRIADVVTKLIDELSIGSRRLIKLEKEVDTIYDNLYSDFCNDVPNLRETDYRIFLFSVLGLSNSVIALFIKEEKIGTIYNRRRRIKELIKKLPEDKQERYLHFLATKKN